MIDTSLLRARSVAFALLARLLGPDTGYLDDPATTDAARQALRAAGAPEALARADEHGLAVMPDAATLAGRWVRWFDLGRVAPYEGSNVAATPAGVTPLLADVAGFYRAFNVAVTGDRPDHVVAQLEFLAVTLIAEAEAREHGDTENAGACAAATRSFLRDHIGGWIDAWANRVGAIDDLAPWHGWAAAAAELVGAEAHRRNVVPLHSAAILPADAGVAADQEAQTSCDVEPTWS